MKKVLILLVVGIACTNSRSLRPKKIKIIQRTTSFGCPGPILDTQLYNCQKISLEDNNQLFCCCREKYGILNENIPSTQCNCKVTNARCDCNIPVAKCDTFSFPDFSCNCQSPITYQYVGNNGCRNGLGDYFTVETVVPVIDPCYVQSQIVNVPTCGCECQNMPCSCQNTPCSCQNTPCTCQNMPCTCQNTPCSCQNMPCICPKMTCSCQNAPCTCQNKQCACQNTPCTCQRKPCCCPKPSCNCQNMPCCCPKMSCDCQNTPCACQTIPCSCQTMSCSCQNMPFSCQNFVDFPCGCQNCQMLPLYSCQSLPSPVIGCGCQYLRQITIPPPC